jgi:hypothetical protein
MNTRDALRTKATEFYIDKAKHDKEQQPFREEIRISYYEALKKQWKNKQQTLKSADRAEKYSFTHPMT